MEELADESIQLIVTSPPYWNVKKYGEKGIGFGQSYDDYVQSMNKIWAECLRVLKPNGKIAINVQPLPMAAERSGFDRRSVLNIMFDVELFMRKNKMFLSSMHYWNKSEYINTVYWGSYPNPTNIGANTSLEQIFVWVKPGPTRKISKEILKSSLLSKNEWRHWAVRCIWDDITPVIKIDSTGKDRFGHSAPFPEDIPYRFIKMHTVEGETVLDPFLGSGTTLKICRLLNRKGFGYEVNSKYKNIIKSRILESWTPPRIEEQYKIIGNDSFYKIFSSIVQNSIIEYKNERSNNINNPGFFKDIMLNVLPSLRKKFPRIFTKSYTNRIRFLIEEDKRKLTKTLIDFLKSD